MKDLQKIDSYQLYMLWKNLSIALLVLIGALTFSRMLPSYISPIVALVAAALLYTRQYNNRREERPSCMLASYTIFLSLIAFCFTTIIINILDIWNVINIPEEYVFFHEPYIPSLIVAPVSFLTTLVVYLRLGRLRICIDCKISQGDSLRRGKMGSLLNYESHFQLKNLLFVFGVLTLIIWSYYLGFYVRIVPNARDWYIFIWLTVIIFILDEFYFMARYYNLYLDFKDNDELITADDITATENSVYMRFYVVCGEDMYLAEKPDPNNPVIEIIDTPFMDRIPSFEASTATAGRLIKKQTGIDNGELKYFYGGKSKSRGMFGVARYFYFLPGKPEDYPSLETGGKWIPFNLIKKIYTKNPRSLAKMFVSDTTRLATIMLTEKIYDEAGNRKVPLKHYRPSFNLEEVRNSVLDFNDEKWIEIALFNADSRLFKLRRWWKNMFGRRSVKNRSWII